MRLDEWQQVKIGKICDVGSSKRIYMKEYVPTGIPFYRSKEIINQFKGEPLSDTLFISEKRFKEIKEKFGVPSQGDILLTSVGTIGVPYLVKENDEFYFKDGNLTWFKNFKNSVRSKYIYYWLQSDLGKKEINSIIIGSTQQALTIESIKKMNILLPPRTIQNKIISILDGIDKKIEINREMNITLEKMALELYKNWFIDKGIDQEQFTINDVKISEFSKIIGGGTPKTNIDEYWSGDIPWISVKDLNSSIIIDTEKKITELGLNNSSTKLIPKFSTVISARGTIGNISILGNEMAMNQSCYAIKAEKEFHIFTYLSIKHSIEKLISNSHGSVFSTITKSTLESIDFPFNESLCSLFEKRVGSFFDQILNNINQNKVLNSTREYLIPRLLSGEINMLEEIEKVREVISNEQPEPSI
ncbi:restriction endonuclease subunit S [Bacillaceae bacterium S4-13-56]